MYIFDNISYCQSQEHDRIFREPVYSQLRLWGVPMYTKKIRGMEHLRSFWAGLSNLVSSPPGEDNLSLPPVISRVDTPPQLSSPETAVLVFTGKGCFGKTTPVCSTTLRLAKTFSNKKILFFAADRDHYLGDCLNTCISKYR